VSTASAAATLVFIFGARGKPRGRWLEVKCRRGYRAMPAPRPTLEIIFRSVMKTKTRLRANWTKLCGNNAPDTIPYDSKDNFMKTCARAQTVSVRVVYLTRAGRQSYVQSANPAHAVAVVILPPALYQIAAKNDFILNPSASSIKNSTKKQYQRVKNVLHVPA
jgi:hypothetical protein